MKMSNALLGKGRCGNFLKCIETFMQFVTKIDKGKIIFSVEEFLNWIAVFTK
jgi:hypothetical protein